MATHPSILALRMLWTEDPDGLQSMVLQSQTQLKNCALKGARVLVLVCFLGCEIEWNVTEQAGKGLRLTTSSPESLTHASCPD